MEDLILGFIPTAIKTIKELSKKKRALLIIIVSSLSAFLLTTFYLHIYPGNIILLPIQIISSLIFSVVTPWYLMNRIFYKTDGSLMLKKLKENYTEDELKCFWKYLRDNRNIFHFNDLKKFGFPISKLLIDQVFIRISDTHVYVDARAWNYLQERRRSLNHK